MSPPGLSRSALTVLNSRESYINVTWTPSASQQGVNFFCYTATEHSGCVKSNIEFIYQSTMLGTIEIGNFHRVCCMSTFFWVLFLILNHLVGIIIMMDILQLYSYINSSVLIMYMITMFAHPPLLFYPLD